MGRTNFAPTAPTIIVTLVLMVVGLACTAGGVISPLLGIAAYVLAEALLLLGCATRRL
ncbi:MAG TPA: hypothetical protein VK592_03115 [Candidatus Dormibacteraeota bacterium]|nr:hypothetical protein [Candidatus Dormibacteraeota bacterium]